MPGTQMMFGFKYFSNAGKTTQGRLVAAQMRDPEADPCYVPVPRESNRVEEEDKSLNISHGPLADLQQALKEAAEDTEKSQADNRSDAAAAKKTSQTWAQHQAKDPNWFFDSTTNRFTEKKRQEVPPPGTYAPRWDLAAPRVLGSEWKLRKHQSRKHLLEKYNGEGEGPQGLPDAIVMPFPVTKIIDWKKQPPVSRDVGHSKNDEYKLEMDWCDPDKLLGVRPRQPCYDMDDCMARPKNEAKASYFQPGQFVVDRAYRCKVGPKFEKCVGRDAFYKQTSLDIIDRSLARDCPYLRPIKCVPDFSKTLPRKEAAQKKFYAEDAAMNFDICKAERAVLPRAHSIANIAKMIPREKAGLANRAACNDPGLVRLRNGDQDLSVELLPLEQIYQSTVRRQVVADFNKFLGREKSKQYMEPPTRHQDYSEYLGFERKPNEYETKTLVPDFTGVNASRRSRSHAELDTWDNIKNDFDGKTEPAPATRVVCSLAKQKRYWGVLFFLVGFVAAFAVYDQRKEVFRSSEELEHYRKIENRVGTDNFLESIPRIDWCNRDYRCEYHLFSAFGKDLVLVTPDTSHYSGVVLEKFFGSLATTFCLVYWEEKIINGKLAIKTAVIRAHANSDRWVPAIIVSLLVVAVGTYLFLPMTKKQAMKMTPSHPVPYEYTLKELAQYDGKVHKQMYVSVKGVVYDVTSSENFVPERGYGMLWGGKDATYALATMSLKPEAVNVEEWGDLNDQNLLTLENWSNHFAVKKKYPIVGSVPSLKEKVKKLDIMIAAAQKRKEEAGDSDTEGEDNQTKTKVGGENVKTTISSSSCFSKQSEYSKVSSSSVVTFTDEQSTKQPSNSTINTSVSSGRPSSSSSMSTFVPRRAHSVPTPFSKENVDKLSRPFSLYSFSATPAIQSLKRIEEEQRNKPKEASPKVIYDSDSDVMWDEVPGTATLF
eukprot:gene383-677_t